MGSKPVLRALGAMTTIGAASLLFSGSAPGYSFLGGSLALDQRDVRVYDAFADPEANDNTTADANFPGYTGAALAIWKATVEWGSELHGNGQGDPHQPGGLGSGASNFDGAWMGLATGEGGQNDNVHSPVDGQGGGVLAFCETPISDGWRIRYFEGETWEDGPGAPGGGLRDLQGVATHEYGHALGLGHSTSVGATMYPSANGTAIAQRSIEGDDIAGLQALYGAKAPDKPRITQAVVDALAGTLTLTGSGFHQTKNELWFTPTAPTAPGADPVVRLSKLSSTAGGTQITAAIPAGAGPGDVLVKLPGGGHDSLSNAWPFDPGGNGPVYGPPTIVGVSPSALGTVGAGPRTVELAGSDFLGVTEVRLGGVAVASDDYAILSDTALTLTIPQAVSIGTLGIELENSFGSSQAAALDVVAPEPPAIAMATSLLFSADGLTAWVGGTPGTPWVLAASLSDAPSILPGVISAGIGAGFTSIVAIGSDVLSSDGWRAVQVPISGLPYGTDIYLQAATLDAVAPALPYVMTNVAGGTYYY